MTRLPLTMQGQVDYDPIMNDRAVQVTETTVKLLAEAREQYAKMMDTSAVGLGFVKLTSW